MSIEMALNFSSKNRATEDFMKMIWALEEVKELLEEAINLNTERHSVDFMRQDIKTLENAKNAILDEKIAEKLDEEIKKKKQKLEEKEKEKTENDEKVSKLLTAYKEFKSYSKMVKSIYDSVEGDLLINIDKMNTEEHLAFLFADICLYVEESASEVYYDEAIAIYRASNSAINELSLSNKK